MKHKLPKLSHKDTTRAGCSLGIVLFNEEDIVIGTIGECRCYVSYRKDPTKAVLFSGNHTTSNRDEEARIVKAGGFIINDRVNGMYPFTRSIGDFHLKNKNCELLTS